MLTGGLSYFDGGTCPVGKGESVIISRGNEGKRVRCCAWGRMKKKGKSLNEVSFELRAL